MLCFTRFLEPFNRDFEILFVLLIACQDLRCVSEKDSSMLKHCSQHLFFNAFLDAPSERSAVVMALDPSQKRLLIRPGSCQVFITSPHMKVLTC